MFTINSFRAATALIAAAALFASTGASAASTSLDVSGVDSFTELGQGNTVLFADVTPFSNLTSISWNVNVTAYDPSWLQDFSFAATDLALTAGVQIQIAPSDEHPGTASYVGSYDLASNGQSFNVGADGVVRVEFFEQFNDSAVSPDGRWNSGTLTFQTAAVPEPSSWALMALGLAGTAVAARRRRAA